MAKKRPTGGHPQVNPETVDKIMRLIQTDEAAFDLLIEVFSGGDLRGRTSKYKDRRVYCHTKGQKRDD